MKKSRKRPPRRDPADAYFDALAYLERSSVRLMRLFWVGMPEFIIEREVALLNKRAGKALRFREAMRKRASRHPARFIDRAFKILERRSP